MLHLTSGRKGSTVLTPSAVLRRLAACCAALAVCVTLASTTGQPVARAADGTGDAGTGHLHHQGLLPGLQLRPRSPHAAAQRAAVSWYEMNNGGHLMIIKNASDPACSRTCWWTPTKVTRRAAKTMPARAPARDCGRRRRSTPPLQAWQRMGQPTIAINANFFDVRAQKGGSWRHDQLHFAAGCLRGQHPRPGPRQRGGHRHRRLPR